jgi:nitrous oxidase accessory protein
MILGLLVAVVAPIVVQPTGPVRTLTAALALARPGDRIVVRAGTYREPLIVVDVPVEISGEGWLVFEGGAHSTLEVRADGVLLHGLVFSHVIPAPTEDRAAILLNGARNCRVENNRIKDGFFGIYAIRSSGCRIAWNRVEGPASGSGSGGNGIHLWQSRDMTVLGNTVSGHRDGIYFEFVSGAAVEGNTVAGNQRYGLHFMRSDSCAYRRNTFTRNGAGVAVMYSRWVSMTDNRFERNWGSAAYGVLLKEISDGSITGNRFVANTVGLYLDDSNRNTVTGNLFQANGWAVKVLANASDNRFERNQFVGNTFDVSTNSRSTSSTFRENWWDHYRGYDLDRDGIGDVPFRPVRLFSLVVEQSEPSLILLRSPFVALLDGAERLMPILTPEALVDRRPLMVRPR